MLSWLFSGWFQKYPNLRIALSEGEIGWIPYFLERAEQVLDKQRHWVKKGVQFTGHALAGDVDLDTLNVRQLYRDHVFGCMIDDVHGLRSLEEIGEDNVMLEVDYPHSDTTWPNCIDLAKKRLAHLAPHVQYKILRGNAERLYQFKAADTPQTAVNAPRS
jgi:predicted TIM-barrel fold metal-dependent hydrolase